MEIGSLLFRLCGNVLKDIFKKRSNITSFCVLTLFSRHCTGCGHRQHPPHSQPFTGDSVWSLGLLLPGASAACHLAESALLCPKHQGCNIRLGRTSFTWSSQHGVRLCNQKNILKNKIIKTCKAVLSLWSNKHTSTVIILQS